MDRDGDRQRTWCGVRVTDAMLVLPPRSAQHATCKRCLTALRRWP